MTRPVPLGGAGDVAASHHAVLTRQQAAELGLTASVLDRMRRREVVDLVAPGVVAFRGAPTTWHQRLAVATMTGGGLGVASHRSAAVLHRIDGFSERLVEVTVPRGARVRMEDALVHQTATPIGGTDIIVIDGIRCTTLARTLVDLPGVVGGRAMERALDDYERRGFSLNWLEQVANRLHRPGQRGTKLVLAEVRRRRLRGVVRGSWFEKLIDECLRSRTLPPLEPQHIVRTAAGELICRVDLAIPSVKVAIECHRRAFHTGDHAEIVDQRRENLAMLEGWQFLYLGWADRKTPAQARRFLEQLVRRRACDLCVTLQ